MGLGALSLQAKHYFSAYKVPLREPEELARYLLPISSLRIEDEEASEQICLKVPQQPKRLYSYTYYSTEDLIINHHHVRQLHFQSSSATLVHKCTCANSLPLK